MKYATSKQDHYADRTMPLRKQHSFKQRNQQRYSWLEDIRDSCGRSPDDPEYDCITLYIPKHAWDQFSPFEKQFWEIKSKHMDTVMFFKKGKFYEIYENDADLGNRHFDLKLTERVNMRMAGVPESSFEYWATRFLKLGYKVAKVTQTESTVKKAMRQRKEIKNYEFRSLEHSDTKTVNRELECILTPGTLCDPALISSDDSSYCISIVELLNTQTKISSFGICILEASVAEFSLFYVEEDTCLVKVLTVLAQTRPKEIVIKKNSLSRQTLSAIKSTLDDVIIVQRIPNERLVRYDDIVEVIRDSTYFTSVPEVLASARQAEICAFGLLLDYLRHLRIDKYIVPSGEFKCYEDTSIASTMFLDAKSITSLEIFVNRDGTTTGTLHKILNKCVTPAGKRLFERLLGRPLVNPIEIEARLEANDEIYDNSDMFRSMQECLSKLPDLERLAARTYAKKISLPLFVALTDGLQCAISALSRFSSGVKSRLLVETLSAFSNSEIEQKIAFFRSCFDEKKALEGGLVEFRSGHLKELDAANDAISNLDRELENYRITQSQRLGCPVSYKNIGKEWFQMEIPKNIKAPHGWKIKSDSASVSRYWDSKIESLDIAYKEALEIRNDAIAGAEQRLYTMFSEHSKHWNSIIKKLASIDVLICLVRNRVDMGSPKCRPAIVNNHKALIHLEDARGPVGTHETYVLNDIHLGGQDPNIMLLTGPNMGGKSTLLRMVCYISIMAQIGCYVPATKCTLTPFDKIFTRIGASDDIVAGRSTFMVELSETRNILDNASSRSLVVLDEFGRGTSTFDGCSVAYAVLYNLVIYKSCIGLFSTHYHLIANSFRNSSLISFKYMDFLAETGDRITFLYKLRDGLCPRSYGMNVASMAGLPNTLIDSAAGISANLEKKTTSSASTKPAFPIRVLCALSSIRDILFDNPSGYTSLEEKFCSLLRARKIYYELVNPELETLKQ